MQTFLFLIFLLSMLLCCVTYFLFPLALILTGKFFKFNIHKKEITPFVSIIISAYNEEKDIAAKIKNTLALDYPEDKFEILIGSDGSQDNTASIVKPFCNKQLKFYNFKENRGKTSVQNDLVNASKADILIFTDAACFLPKNSIKKMVRNFADNRVGCVAGKLRFVDTDRNLITQSQGLYWRYEVMIRKFESNLGSLIGVDGPLYAVRKKYYIPLEPEIISDLMTPLLILHQGQKVILEPEAFVDEKPTQQSKDEFSTRRRIILRGMTGIFSYKNILNPVKHPIISLQIFTHKILRWFVGPLILLNVFALTGLLVFNYFPAKLLLPLYFLFFISAFFGLIFEKMGKKIKILTIPFYFCLVNLAATFGIVDFFRKKQAITWNTVRD